jgi:HAD superfamily hydrolase (TIGR01484 family)
MMRYHVLASDYDGTLAHHGRVDEPTVASLEKFLATGRKLVLVTGRELPELIDIFPQLHLFDWVVAENGALLYQPSTKTEKLLVEPPSEKFVQMLKARGVERISVGRGIVATWEPYENMVLDSIRDLGLELQVIFNKGAVMVLPASVNKATGLSAVLKEMGLSPHNAIGIGDAENDHALLRYCEFSVAVANALPAVKETADFVTRMDHGAGVADLIEQVLADDLDRFSSKLHRHHLSLGKSGDEEIALSPFGRSVLICGPSASGKSTLATRILETLHDQRYQFCLFDPEGDYPAFENAVVFGGPKAAPSEEEILKFLEGPRANAIVCLTGMPIPDRPPFFLSLFAKLLQMRSKTGRPHWLVLDEAHHLMPAEWQLPQGILPDELMNVLLITVHPELLAPTLLERMDTVLAVGPTAPAILREYAKAAGIAEPAGAATVPESGECLLWLRDAKDPPRCIHPHPCRTERHRHRRKYAEGELPLDRSFFFRGPEGKLKLRAQNLVLFLQIGDGVDDETWDFHLRQGHYSAWFREAIKDEKLAKEVQKIESLLGVSAADSRKLVREAVERDYTLPASPLPVPGAS